MSPTSGWSAADADRLNLLRAEAVRADLELHVARARGADLRDVTDRLERRREEQFAPRVGGGDVAGGASGAPHPLPSPCSKEAADVAARPLFGLPAGSEVLWRPSQSEAVQAASIPGAHVLLTAPTGWGKNALAWMMAMACCNETLVIVLAPCRVVALQMFKDYTGAAERAALGPGCVHCPVSQDTPTPAAEPPPDPALAAAHAAELAELAHEDRPRKGTTGDVLLAAVAGGCRVVILTAEGLSAISHSGASIRVALGAVMDGLTGASGPKCVSVVVDEHHNAIGFRKDIAAIGTCFRTILGRAMTPVDPRRLGLVAMSAHVFPADQREVACQHRTVG